MGRVARARRLARAAAYGGGGLGVVGAAVVGLIAAESKLARRAIPAADEIPPAADGLYGDHAHVDGTQRLWELGMLGDSSAAGFGVDDPNETPGAMLAAGIAEITGRPVRLRVLARVGAQTSDLEGQVELALALPPDAVLIMVGANDVTHRVWPAVSVRLLGESVTRLRAAGVEVVVGTCPDLGTIEPVAQPLRTIARRWSRQLAAAQTIAVVEAGGRSVSLGDILGPEFAARPKEMFAADRFHPSAAGYRAAAMTLLPSLAAALGHDIEGEGRLPDARRGEGVRPVAEAAVEAAETAGTEVCAAEGGDGAGGGLWTLLRHRRRRQLPDAVRTDGAPPDGVVGDSGHREEPAVG